MYWSKLTLYNIIGFILAIVLFASFALLVVLIAILLGQLIGPYLQATVYRLSSADFEIS
jgi:hypothetical protein